MVIHVGAASFIGRIGLASVALGDNGELLDSFHQQLDEQAANFLNIIASLFACILQLSENVMNPSILGNLVWLHFLEKSRPQEFSHFCALKVDKEFYQLGIANVFNAVRGVWPIAEYGSGSQVVAFILQNNATAPLGNIFYAVVCQNP